MNELIDNFKKVIFHNFANFTGRADRTEMWLFVAVFQIVFMLLYMILYPFIMLGSVMTSIMSIGGSSSIVSFFPILLIYGLFLIIILIACIPLLAISVRRLHDTGRSGWYILLSFIPFLGSIPLLILLCIDGEQGENYYGANPKLERYREEYAKYNNQTNRY